MKPKNSIFGNFIIPINNTYVKDFERKYIKNRYQNNFRNLHIQIEKGTQVYIESFDNKNNIGYKFTKENVRSIIESEIGKTFVKVLEDAGVYKRTADGKAAFERFVDYVNRV